MGRRLRRRPLYSACNEDTRSELLGLACGPSDTVVAIASGGGRALSLLASEPTRLVAVDLAEEQIVTLELKAAAMDALDHEAFCAFLGLTRSRERGDAYVELRPALSPGARRYWDARTDLIREGVLYAGRAEATARRFLWWLRRWGLLDWAVRWFEIESLEEQHLFLRREASRLRLLELALRLYCHPAVVFSLTQDRGFLRSSQGSIGRYMFRRILRWTSANLIRDSFALHLFYFGHYAEVGPLPPYLTREGFDRAKKCLDRLELHRARIEDFALRSRLHGRVKWSLSDVGAWMSERAFHDLLRSLVHQGEPGSRYCARNFAAVRATPLELRDRVTRLEALARDLGEADSSVFWGFEVGELGGS
jgi:S-adenosylmethionine-diacylglycerol 3-amino-3-carboxypropyl transferase